MDNKENIWSKNTFRSNTVLDSNYRPSSNFFASDKILTDYLAKTTSKDTWKFLHPKLDNLGKIAAIEMDKLSLEADKNPPWLRKRNFLGQNIDEIIFHPAYDKLLEIAAKSSMFSVKWKPEMTAKFPGQQNRMSFALVFLYGLAESSICCPLCMTDGAAKIISKYADLADRERLMKHFFTEDVNELFTGAMFLTEKSGGSDVGSISVRAKKIQGKYYRLNGEKWFCSNASAEVKLVLARTGNTETGTKGLSLFLVENHKTDGNKNHFDTVRLKDKLGVRSMASAEIIFTDTEGTLIGEEGKGFKIMAEMINLSRLWNAVIALAAFRRCLIEVFQFLSHRYTFGKSALEHALVRGKLYELACSYVADFFLIWEVIRHMDRTEIGDGSSAEKLRLLTPLIKKQSAETAVYGIRECMELMGGMGYMEDGVIPKFMRDTLVLPIWEGTSNMMVLDFLRASSKTKGLEIMLDELRGTFSKDSTYKAEAKRLESIKHQIDGLSKLERDEMEFRAKTIVEEVTKLIQLDLLVNAKSDENKPWVGPAIAHLQSGQKASKLPSVQEISGLLAWDF